MTLTRDSQARKEAPMARGLLDYFPDALAAVARLSLKGNDKHNPGEPIHWSRHKSDDHADCIIRHLADRGQFDDDGELHDTKVAWRALAQLQLAIEALTPIPERDVVCDRLKFDPCDTCHSHMCEIAGTCIKPWQTSPATPLSQDGQ